MTDQLLSAASQVTAALANADGTSNVYLTADPALNALTLTLRNGLSDAVVFPAGTPVAYGDLPKDQSGVYLFLNGLIGNDDVAGIVLAAPGWQAGTFADPGTGLQYLVIAPASDVTVQPGGLLTFTLTNVLADGSPRTGTADIDLAGAAGLTPQQGEVPLFVTIANPPQQAKHPLGLQIGFDRPTVYTGQAQTLTLYLVNTGQTALVPGGTPAWGGVTPTFQVTPVCGGGAGALTSADRAAQIAMSISDAYGNVWQPPQRHVQGQNPHWTMQPDPNGGGTVLGDGENAGIEFAITGIEATLPAGLDSALTVVHVSWRDIPGYDDGTFGVVVTKKAGPSVVAFTAVPSSVPADLPSVQSILTWDTAHATGVRFEVPGVSSGQEFSASGSGPVEGGVTVAKGSALTLIAYQDISSDRTVPLAERSLSADEEITATATLHITTQPSRTDVPTGLDNLGFPVPLPASSSLFAFQMQDGVKAVQINLATKTVAKILDLASLIPPPQSGEQRIQGAKASPSGKTIHVLVSVGNGPAPLYIVALDVATATYGQPVPLGTVDSGGSIPSADLFATPDGRTVYVLTNDLAGFDLVVRALDPGTYAVKGSWTWSADQTELLPWAIASSEDGSILVSANADGVVAVEVTTGIVKGTLAVPEPLSFVSFPVVSADLSRVGVFGVGTSQNPSDGHLLVADADLGIGSLTLVSTVELGPLQVDPPGALSPDGKTFYVVRTPDVLTGYDTKTWSAVQYVCGTGGVFAPRVMVSSTQPNVLYSTGNQVGGSDAVSIITLP
jgi:hypothetical protein